MKEFEDILLERFGEGRPILVGDILSLFPDVSRVTVYQRINSAISKGSLERYGRGVYCIPRQGLFGKVPLSAESVIERKFIACGDEVFGYYSGLALENRAGLSEQVPAVLEITTNASSKGVRSLGPAGGWKDSSSESPDARQRLRTSTCSGFSMPCQLSPQKNGQGGTSQLGRPCA